MEILYFDREIIVCLKPVGVDSEAAVSGFLQEDLGGEVFPVHRLDLNVGGVMVYARTKSTAAALSKAIKSGEMRKEYVAAVHGAVPEKGDWTDYLWKDSCKNKVYVVKRPRNGVKQARLTYTRIREAEPALVHIRLYTGRSHQIRVQFASRGYPLVGDHKYGARDNIESPMLYSCRLSFPYQGERRTFEAFPDWAKDVFQDK